MSTSHTPGPWNVERRDLPDNGGTYFKILPAGPQDAIARTFSGSQQESNAHLIAAAPKLEEALEALLDVLYDGRMDEPQDKEEEAIRMAEDALALVRGK